MSTFENDQYRWRETYFVLFDSAKRPTLKKLQRALSRLSNRFTLTNFAASEQGEFESLTVLAPDDFAALDVCYLCGEEVLEQGSQWAEELASAGCNEDDRKRLNRLRRCDGRFDLLHFEQIADVSDENELNEMLDPSALLMVLDTLIELTDGIAVDPQSGSLL